MRHPQPTRHCSARSSATPSKSSKQPMAAFARWTPTRKRLTSCVVTKRSTNTCNATPARTASAVWRGFSWLHPSKRHRWRQVSTPSAQPASPHRRCPKNGARGCPAIACQWHCWAAWPYGANATGGGLGAILLADACQRVDAASQKLAVAALVVDAKSSQAAAFYAHFGFIALLGQSGRWMLPRSHFAGLG